METTPDYERLYRETAASVVSIYREATTGVVSGVNRSMPTAGGFAVPDAVQTDAPIDPGNSGGPLVSATDGYPVVGVNRAKSGDAVGFAVSARVVATVVPTLLEEGRYRHASLGVQTADVTPQVATANGTKHKQKALLVDCEQVHGLADGVNSFTTGEGDTDEQ